MDSSYMGSDAAPVNAALDCALFGIPVFPCGADKKPLVANGFKAATTDQAQVEAWWRQWPGANIAARPIDIDGAVVLDIDPRHDPDPELVGQIKAAAAKIIQTPSGGWHCYFGAERVPYSNRALAAGIDTRCANGYVLLPGSPLPYLEVKSGALAPLPAEWKARLAKAEETQGEPLDEPDDDPGPEYVEAASRYLARLVEDPGRYKVACTLARNCGLTTATALRLWEESGYRTESTRESGLGANESPEDKIAHARRYGKGTLGGGPIFKILMQIGRRKAWFQAYFTEEPVWRQGQEISNQDGRAMLDKLIADLGGVTPRVRLRSRAEALARPAPQMLVEGLVPERKLILPWGFTGEGKTYFIAELATAIATRRPAFGQFRILRPGDSGVVVMFMGEDCTEFDQGRLTAIEQQYGRSLEGLVFTTDLALPLDDPELFGECVAEIRRIRDQTGRPIDAIFDDTLGRTLGTLPPNDGETGHKFTVAMEDLIAEFGCSVVVNAHEPKAGGTISGTQRFLDNAAVTPHIEGEKRSGELLGFKVTMEPKFRVGSPPKPFTVKARPVTLPKPVNGSHSDLVFTMESRPIAAANSLVRAKLLGSLGPSPMHIDYVCQASGLTRDTIKNHVRGKSQGGKVKVKADCADLVECDIDGQIPGRADNWYLKNPIAIS